MEQQSRFVFEFTGSILAADSKQALRQALTHVLAFSHDAQDSEEFISTALTIRPYED